MNTHDLRRRQNTIASVWNEFRSDVASEPTRNVTMKAPPLEFHLSVARPDEGRFTTADLQIRIDGRAVWPVLGEDAVALEIQIDDLLSHLAEFWKPLMRRRVYPLAAHPDRPSLLRAEVARRWSGMPREVADREDDILTAFEEAHDLSHAFGGLFGLPAFWLIRAGDQIVCESADQTWRLNHAETRNSLSAIGDAIAERLEGHDGGRWAGLIEAWRARDRGEAVASREVESCAPTEDGGPGPDQLAGSSPRPRAGWGSIAGIRASGRNTSTFQCDA
jgi:hypothetical protein